MPKYHLDRLDCKIIDILSRNARTSLLEIGRECGVSGAAIHQRVQKLVETGIIDHFDTMISPRSLDLNLRSFIGIMLENPADAPQVIERMREIPEIVECHTVTGPYDLLIKVFARDADHLFEILHGSIEPVGSFRTDTFLSFVENVRRQVPVNPTKKRRPLAEKK